MCFYMERLYQNKPVNIAIVGAGPSGVYCALNILQMFKQINFDNYLLTIFEKGKILHTLLPTGGTRCNITNSKEDIKEFCSNYPRGEKFLYSLFSRYSNFETIEFFNSIGVETYVESDGRVFPKSNSSKDVREKMLNKLFSYKNVKIIKKQINHKQELDSYDKIVISIGSRSGYNLITEFNHTYIPFKKALCALVVDDFKYPKGVSVKALDGDFLFTNNGISGPLAYKISSINAYKDFPYEIKIKLFCEDYLIEETKKFPKKSIINVLSKFIPK